MQLRWAGWSADAFPFSPHDYGAHVWGGAGRSSQSPARGVFSCRATPSLRNNTSRRKGQRGKAPRRHCPARNLRGAHTLSSHPAPPLLRDLLLAALAENEALGVPQGSPPTLLEPPVPNVVKSSGGDGGDPPGGERRGSVPGESDAFPIGRGGVRVHVWGDNGGLGTRCRADTRWGGVEERE